MGVAAHHPVSAVHRRHPPPARLPAARRMTNRPTNSSVTAHRIPGRGSDVDQLGTGGGAGGKAHGSGTLGTGGHAVQILLRTRRQPVCFTDASRGSKTRRREAAPQRRRQVPCPAPARPMHGLSLDRPPTHTSGLQRGADMLTLLTISRHCLAHPPSSPTLTAVAVGLPTRRLQGVEDPQAGRRQRGGTPVGTCRGRVCQSASARHFRDDHPPGNTVHIEPTNVELDWSS